MDQLVFKPSISPEEMARRRQAVEQARAANIRQGYTHDAMLEAVNERFISGEISLAEFSQEIDEAMHAGR
jgi:uncharacterized membrane protein